MSFGIGSVFFIRLTIISNLYFSTYYIYKSHKCPLYYSKLNRIDKQHSIVSANEWRKGQMGKQIFDRTKKALSILLVVLFIATLTATSVSAQKTINVNIQNFAYNPASVQVSSGDTVRWTNMDSVDHTVTGSTFDSGMIHTGKSYEFRFTTPGVYNYHCSPHPYMIGTVTVV